MYKEKGEQIIKYANLIREKFTKTETTEEEKIIESLEDAKEAWKSKEEYFQAVSEVDLVDHAIYELEASKIKYIYLLKQYKKINNK